MTSEQTASPPRCRFGSVEKPLEVCTVSHTELEVQDETHHEWTDFVKFTQSTLSASVVPRRNCRTYLQDLVDSIFVQTFIFCLVIVDLVLGLTAIVKDEATRSIITLVIIILYCLEIALRIVAYGPRKYFSSILDVIDFLAVVVSLVLYIFSFYVVYTLLVKALRWTRVLRTTYRALCSRSKKLQRAIRHLQRSNLKGFRDDEYELDIAYITPSILIMSRPATKALEEFTNDALADVKRFLNEKHSESYLIYDLCVYDHSSKQQILDDMVEYTKEESAQIMHEAFTDGICNEFAFSKSSVLGISDLLKFVEHSGTFSEQQASNVVIIQSAAGLGRAMFLCVCLLCYSHPNVSLAEIYKFIKSEREQNCDDNVQQEDLFADLLPSQTRYMRYFATMIQHCYRVAYDSHDLEDEDMDAAEPLERALTEHIQQVHHAQTMTKNLTMDEQTLSRYVDDENDGQTDRSKWNFFHKYAIEMLESPIGVVVKEIGVYNFYDEIDPYIDWVADTFQWSNLQSSPSPSQQQQNNDYNTVQLQYRVSEYGRDTQPATNSAVIQRSKKVPPKVFENDFGIRIYKMSSQSSDGGGGDGHKRKLIAQVILHSHFINLNEDDCIRFEKQDIDFVNTDVNHKLFPEDFHIVIRAKILRKKM